MIPLVALVYHFSGVAVVGNIPRGLAGHIDFFAGMSSSTGLDLLKGAISIAVISFMETIAMATQGICIPLILRIVKCSPCVWNCMSQFLCAVNRKYAKGSVLDSSQELFSIGFMNLFTSLFQGYPVAGACCGSHLRIVDVPS